MNRWLIFNFINSGSVASKCNKLLQQLEGELYPSVANGIWCRHIKVSSPSISLPSCSVSGPEAKHQMLTSQGSVCVCVCLCCEGYWAPDLSSSVSCFINFLFPPLNSPDICLLTAFINYIPWFSFTPNPGPHYLPTSVVFLFVVFQNLVFASSQFQGYFQELNTSVASLGKKIKIKNVFLSIWREITRKYQQPYPCQEGVVFPLSPTNNLHCLSNLTTQVKRSIPTLEGELVYQLLHVLHPY